MDRRSKIIIGLFVAVLLGIIIIEIVRPKPLNWKPSYTDFDKIPFGCFVLYGELPSIFPDETIVPVDQSAYETLANRDSTEKTNYIFINNTTDFDQEETQELLDYVSDGNDVFIASTYFGSRLSDTLNLHVQSSYTVQEDTTIASLTNVSFGGNTYDFIRGYDKSSFSSVDTLSTTILGYVEYKEKNYPLEGSNFRKKKKEVNFVKVKFGEGNFYLNTIPQAYTNYYMLGGNASYAANTLSYLENRKTYWDNYEKSGRIIIDSPMRFVLNQASLKWAYYLTLTGLLLFVIFKAKREQRIIPVITPLENSSVEFARTVGSLYYQHRDYTDLISKKLNYFLEYVRSHYYLDTTNINDKTARDLAAKSGKSITETKELLDYIIYLKNRTEHSEHDVIQLNKKIASFKE